MDNVEELASELGCKVGTFPTPYLGLPLGAKHKALGVWDSIEERFRMRLAPWKIQYISKGGRATLIRITLSSLPIYYLSLFRMPQKVSARLERIQRQFLWGGNDHDKKIALELASELGCKVGTFPTPYLGLPLGAKHKALGVWDSIEERFRMRLAPWKIQYISKGGRATLIRITLSSLPIYYLSLFRMPQKVSARLERIQRQFLWGGNDHDKKIALVKWATVCTAKRKGGIGIKSFSNMNKALLSKWSWRFANDRNSLWRRAIRCKFGESSGGWHTCDLRGGYGTSLWKEIRKEWPFFFPKLGLRPRGWKKDQVLERCLMWWGGFVC